MNLHGIVTGAISAVNPFVPVGLQISTGSVIAPGGVRTPSYASPGAFTGEINGSLLTVSAVAQGRLMIGQAVAGAGVAAGTVVRAYGTGTGGIGTYVVSKAQTVASGALTTSLTVMGQIQSLTAGEIEHLDTLNIQGQMRALYINGKIDGLIRPDEKGGDLVTTQDGRVWLVANMLEYWPDWCKAALVLQNGS